MTSRGGSLVLLGAAIAATILAQTSTTVAGHWEGKIQLPNRELGVSVDLARTPKGLWIGSMSVLGSSAVDVPLSSVSVEDRIVRFKASLPEPASFDGRLSVDAGVLSGTATNHAGEAEFQLTRSGEAKVKVPPPSSPLSKEFEGVWDGTLEAGGQTRKVGLKLSADAGGAAMAILIGQGNLEIPVTTVAIQGNELRLEARAVSGTYQGTLRGSGEIAGEWTQGADRFPVTFKRAASETNKP